MNVPPGAASHLAVCDYREAMAITGLRKTKLYDLFRRGILRGYRDGRMIRFYRAVLLAYMRERENAPAVPNVKFTVRSGKGRAPGVRFKFL